MDAKFSNYCLIVLSNIERIKEDILKVAEFTKPHYLDATGLLIATFTSIMSPQELTEYFQDDDIDGRSFMLFELNKDVSGVYMDNPEYHQHLFEYLINRENTLKSLGDKLIEDITNSGDTKEFNNDEKSKRRVERVFEEITKKNKKGYKKPPVNDIPDVDVDKLTSKEKTNMINDLIDKGIDNLSKKEYDLLNLLSKSGV
jgi:hypothetical protein